MNRSITIATVQVQTGLGVGDILALQRRRIASRRAGTPTVMSLGLYRECAGAVWLNNQMSVDGRRIPDTATCTKPLALPLIVPADRHRKGESDDKAEQRQGRGGDNTETVTQARRST